MIGHCPRCNLPLELPESGSYACTRCRRRFEAYLLQPRPPRTTAPAPAGYPYAPGLAVAPPVAAAPAAPAGPCAAHPTNPAVDVCERCGDFMCALCRTHIEGRRYCPRCFDLLYSRGSLVLSQRSFNSPTLSLVLGLVAWPTCMCPLVSLPAGIFGILMGANSLKEIARRPDLPGRGLAIAGIVFAGLGILVTLGYWGFMLYRLLRSM